jgi:Xaa-Pro aminopeptidase
MLLTRLSDNAGFVEFETISYVPFCRKLIEISMLDSSEIDWLNSYNKKIRQRIFDEKLDDCQKSWCEENIEAI